MKTKNFIISVLVLIIILNSLTNAAIPKRELRGVWIVTIKNIDWPSKPGLSSKSQKFELKKLFDSLNESGINAVFFQIRAECDALYLSETEPWSYYITGKQGKPPSPIYDPLHYAIKLARARGMEFHAWINPFRVKSDTAGYSPDTSHISFQHPEWILQSGKYQLLNPGIPDVRDYVKHIILDVVNRYDIDGIHFDDYFYPYSGISYEDIETFKMYNRGIPIIEDWRRDNINIFVREIYESIKAIKPFVKFGISPFGIWKDGIPRGIKGFSSYHQIYSDAVNWLQNGLVDYIAPQIYWRMGGDQDYAVLSNWWMQQSNNRHLYIGQALYKLDRKLDPWNINDITQQIKYNQQHKQNMGSIFFRAKDILLNINGIAETLKQDYYKFPAIIPKMAWIDSVAPPLFPFNLRAFPSPDGIFLIWENPLFNKIENQISYNVIYRFEKDSIIDISKGEKVLSVLSSNQRNFVDTTGTTGKEYTYVVTGMDRLFNEGRVSNPASAIFSQLEIKNSVSTENKLCNLNSGETRIKFSITSIEIVNLSIFNNDGEKIYNLLNEELTAGEYSINFYSDTLKPGKYYYKLTTPTFSEMKSFIKPIHRAK